MFVLEQNGPAIAQEMRVEAATTGKPFVAVAIGYDRSNNITSGHRTLKAAHRALGHMISAHGRGRFAAAIVAPQGIMNWNESKAAIALS